MKVKSIKKLLLILRECSINLYITYLDLSTNHSDDCIISKEVICRKNKSLRRVLYKIPDCMDFKERTDINKSDMLTVVVEISVCNHIKVNNIT